MIHRGAQLLKKNWKAYLSQDLYERQYLTQKKYVQNTGHPNVLNLLFFFIKIVKINQPEQQAHVFAYNIQGDQLSMAVFYWYFEKSDGVD